MAKTDDGFKQSEKMLNELEAKIHREYAQAKKEMGEKVDAYFAKFERENYAKEQAVKQGRMSVKEYNDWRMRKMATGKQYIAMRNTLAKDLTNTDKIAMKMVNQALPDVYALNMNYGTYSIEKDSKINTSFTLYNHAAVERLIKDNPKLLPSPKVDIPKDLRWNQQHIQSAITQGILQGKSIPKIAKDLQRVTGMDENAAIRNARTAMTGAQNAGRLDSMKRAAARGIGVKKGWLSTLDNVTRDSHVDLDGEVQEIDRTFSNGLMYPGDASGAPAEVYNCRCRLTHEYDKYKTDWSNPANRNISKLGNMSYQEWKDKHKAKKIENEQDIFKYVVPKVSYIDALHRFTSDKYTEIRKASNGEEIFAQKFDIKTKTRTTINVTEKYKNDADAIEVFIYEKPNVNDVLYRGITVDDETLNSFKENAIIDQKGISSWTKDKKTAENFGRISDKTPNKVVFVEKNGTDAGRDVTDISLASGFDKNEVIQSAYNQQKIIEIKKEGDTTYIYVEEVKKKRN